MPAPKKYNLDRYRDDIEEKLAAAWTQDEILAWLQEEMEEAPVKRTLKRALQDWGMTSLRYQNQPEARSGILVDAIDRLVHRDGLYTNESIVDALKRQGIHSSCAQVRNIRLERGWTLRHRLEDQQQAAWEKTKALCWQAIEEGPARDWGRGHLQVHLRLEYNWNAALNHIQEALSLINIERGVERRPGMQSTRRFEALYHGPNFVWCIDGHCKLSPFGIDIYGAIDGYSRKLIWLYVGVSNQTQVSVAKQFLNAVEEYNIRPKFIRADRGSEVPMLLDTQFNFYRAAEVMGGRCPRDLVDTLSIMDCNILGKSTSNQRIEQIWQRLIVAQLRQWRILFRALFNRQLFRSDTPSDRVVLLYVFMPIIRKEIAQWMHVHNHRRIRKDNKRPNHVSGKPSDLYQGIVDGAEQPRDYGVKPCKKTLRDHQAMLADYDLDPYLPQESMDWCEQTMLQISRAPERPTSRLFFQQRPKVAIVIPSWYSDLVEAARAYNRPHTKLPLLPTPTGAYNWIPHPQVHEAMEREFDDVDPNLLSDLEEFSGDSEGSGGVEGVET